MSETHSEPEITLNATASRFEVESSAAQPSALLAFRQSGATIDLLHTEVAPEERRRGVGAALVKTALDYAKQNRLRVVPSCPFVRAYIERHPEYGDLVRQQG